MKRDDTDLHQLHTLQVAAKRLAVSERTLRRQIDYCHIQAVRIGRSIRVSEAEIRRVVREGLAGV